MSHYVRYVSFFLTIILILPINKTMPFDISQEYSLLFDESEQPSYTDENGRLHVRATVTRTGVAVYKYRLPDGKIIVTRHVKLPEDILADTVVEAMKTAHVTEGHPPKSSMVSTTNYKDFSVGVAKNAWVEENKIIADLIIFNQDTINKIKKKELKYISMGAMSSFVVKKGEFEGEKYDIIQRNIRPNHIALLKDDPRMGKKMKIHTDSQKIYDFLIDNDCEIAYDKESEGQRTMSKIKNTLLSYFKGKGLDNQTLTDVEEIIDQEEEEEKAKDQKEKEETKDNAPYKMKEEEKTKDQEETEKLKDQIKSMKDFMNKEGLMSKFNKDMGHHSKEKTKDQEEEEKTKDMGHHGIKKDQEEEEKTKDSHSYILELRAENKVLQDKLNGKATFDSSNEVAFLIESREAFQTYIGDSDKVQPAEFYTKKIIEKAGIFDQKEIVMAASDGLAGLLPYYKASMKVLKANPLNARKRYDVVSNGHNPISDSKESQGHVAEARERVATFSFNPKDRGEN